MRKSNKGILVIGVTGSIGAGKSAAAKILSKLGLRIYDADKAVENIFREDKDVIKKISQQFPKAAIKGKINKRTLYAEISSRKKGINTLESIVLPAELRAEKEFIKKAKKDKISAVALDVPLLFEIRRDKLCDETICICASKEERYKRALSRKNMSKEKFERLCSLQLSQKEKAAKAIYKISNPDGLRDFEEKVIKVWKKIQQKHRMKCEK